ncbi:MAG: PIN domain-containing protein, partial [Marmoricola sp.]
MDTSVLLADPGAMKRFEEHEVVLPVVVITELEGKRHHPELGYFARSALRMLDELRVEAGRLDRPVP